MEFIQQDSSNKSASAGVVVKKSPTDFLKQVIGKPVVVKLHSGVTFEEF
jgi:hypothetical protein